MLSQANIALARPTSDLSPKITFRSSEALWLVAFQIVVSSKVFLRIVHPPNCPRRRYILAGSVATNLNETIVQLTSYPGARDGVVQTKTLASNALFLYDRAAVGLCNDLACTLRYSNNLKPPFSNI